MPVDEPQLLGNQVKTAAFIQPQLNQILIDGSEHGPQGCAFKPGQAAFDSPARGFEPLPQWFH